jgi:glyoxylase-like metal-dependent hydrolase (beta-lactamase superfamily II)
MRNDRTGWTEPGAFEVAPGVHRIPLPLPRDGLRAINVYAIEDGGRLVLVDCGWRHPKTTDALRAGIAAIGADPKDIKLVLCTHAHYDHYGLTAYIRDHAGATIALGDKELESLNPAFDGGGWGDHKKFRREWMLRHSAEDLLAVIEEQLNEEDFEATRAGGRWERPDRLLAAGEVVELEGRRLICHLTPGHTRGHIAFEDPDARLLFAGDHVLPHITPSLGFESFPDGKALERFLPALRAVRDLDVDLVLPGHGPVFDDLAVRVDELLAHHDTRLAACMDIVAKEGPASARTVASGLTWTRHETPFADLDIFNSMLAVSETVTHLELLADTDKLRRDQNGGVRLRYALAR